MKKGKIFLILGPSGSGKGTVMTYLRKEFKDAVFPISCTTRRSRPGEHDGDVYYFLNRDEFKKKIDAGEFLEWAKVHNDNLYGTLKKPILDALAAGKIVIREVDMQGVQSIRDLLPAEQVVSIFITAPSWENLRARILKRSKIPPSELLKREESFKREMKFAVNCDFVVKSEENRIQEFCQEVSDIISKSA